MATMAEDCGLVTRIDVFAVEPSNQQELIALLADATETSVRDVPGFVSAALHRSVDGAKVTTYSQWRSAEHYQRCVALRSSPGAAPDVERLLALAKVDLGMFEVVGVFDGPAAPHTESTGG